MQHRLGDRCVVDLLADDGYDPEFQERLEELETALCERAPHRLTARSWQVTDMRS